MQLTEHLASPNSQRSAKSESELSSSLSLTAHFTLEEFTRSATAQRLNIPNIPNAQQIDNMRNLCEQVLEPLRGYYGRPIIITSGYRSPPLNKAVGGVDNSQHQAGEAVDIQVSPRGDLEGVAAWIMDNCPFDQLILEKRGTSQWLHISCKKDLSKNRQVQLTINK